ncbi:DUF4190 domain-containing protein [Streptomyces lavendofoliae]|uniref:DUF4190 domain-containing protein n=1 Tax=Streptomyces lavendofoliae TaxID=67314 RepID=UPI003D8EF092
MSDFSQQPQHGTQPYPGTGQYGGAPGQYGDPGQYGAPVHQQPPRPARNGLGTAALVLGILGTLAGVVPLMFWLAGILGLIALVLGLVGRGRVKRGEATNKGVTTAGAVLGLIAMILSVVGAVLLYKVVDDAVNEATKASSSTAPKDPAGGGSGAPAAGATGKADKGKPLAAGDTSVYDDDLQVTVSAATSVKAGEFAIGHTEGNKVYEVTITVENAGKEKFSTDGLTVGARAGENGVTAEEIFDGETYGTGFTGSVLPGKKATVKYAFDAPADAGSLTVEVTPGFDYDAAQWDLKL